jgi:hypothetical protein
MIAMTGVLITQETELLVRMPAGHTVLRLQRKRPARPAVRSLLPRHQPPFLALAMPPDLMRLPGLNFANRAEIRPAVFPSALVLAHTWPEVARPTELSRSAPHDGDYLIVRDGRHVGP